MRELTPTRVALIRKLLEEGLSQRKVALTAQVSRNTVHKIVSGQYPDYEAIRHARKEAAAPRKGPIKRCRECGCQIQMPCLICIARRARKRKLRERVFRHLLDREEPLRLELMEEDRRRYEMIRAMRDGQGDGTRADNRMSSKGTEEGWGP